MKAFRIQNDIVAAADSQKAIAAWAEHYKEPYNAAGPVEEVPLTLEIQVEEPEGEWRDGTLDEVMPAGDEPAQIVCFGECEC